MLRFSLTISELCGLRLLAVISLGLLSGTAGLGQPANTNANPVIIPGVGWGAVAVNADRAVVEKRLGTGEGEEGSEYLKGVYFRQYPEFGIEVSYTHKENKVVAIFFYNKQHRYENLATAPVRTNKGVDFSTTYKQLKKIYGKPKKDYHGDPGDNWRRVVYKGIDFRFENDVMVRIGIPGR